LQAFLFHAQNALGWHSVQNTLDGSLASSKKLDMLTVITGFIFTADNPIAKIAEFKAGYSNMASEPSVA